MKLVGMVGVASMFAVTLGACAPSEPFTPLAVRLEGSTVEVRYTACDRAKVKSAKVIALRPGQKVIDGKEPVLWQVHFATPTFITALEVGGKVPDGASVDVPLARPLDSATRCDAFLELDNGTNPHHGFEVAKLKNGYVAFEDKYVSEQEFWRKSECK